MSLRVGCVCYAHSRGIAHIARDLYRHGVVTDVMVVKHPTIPWHPDWYPGAPVTGMRPLDAARMRDFCAGVDRMVFVETPFDWSLVPFCRERGVKTALVVMHECTPARHPPPDLYVCPSLLDVEYFKHHDHVFLPVPTEYPWRLRGRAEHFVHRGGYLGVRGREGTTTLIEAMPFVKSPIRLTIQVQENVSPHHQRLAAADPRVEYVARQVPYEELYAAGDVAVGAQKWNGMSLVLQEARASGMLVMNTDRFPANQWLPREPLIPVREYRRGSRLSGAYLPFDEAVVDPRDVAATIDAWFEKPIADYSRSGLAWAQRNSWEALKPLWMEALSS